MLLMVLVGSVLAQPILSKHEEESLKSADYKKGNN